MGQAEDCQRGNPRLLLSWYPSALSVLRRRHGAYVSTLTPELSLQ
jgi:hypothetical protein